MEKYAIEDVMNLYGIDSWGGGYFDINDDGKLCVAPTRDETLQVDLHKEVSALQKKGVTAPLLIRFPQLLEAQVSKLCGSFNRAIDEFAGRVLSGCLV